MKKLNKKGFTLVELLAVIVVLAIIIIIAMPNIIRAMNNARMGTFITYGRRIINTATGQFEGDRMMGTEKKCYTLADMGMTSGNYKGRVVINDNDPQNITYTVHLTDNNFWFLGQMSQLDERTNVKPESISGFSVTCP